MLPPPQWPPVFGVRLQISAAGMAPDPRESVAQWVSGSMYWMAMSDCRYPICLPKLCPRVLADRAGRVVSG